MHGIIKWFESESAVLERPVPFRLIGTAASGFYRTCFDKEPTLSQARTKLDSVFMADNRCFS